MSPLVATEHIYEYDADGNPTRLLVAEGDYVPPGLDVPKGKAKEEAVAVTDAQATALNAGSPHLTEEQAAAVVAENEASYAAGRAADMAASPHSQHYPVEGDAVSEGGYGDKAKAPDADKAADAAEKAGDKAQRGPKEPAKPKSKPRAKKG